MKKALIFCWLMAAVLPLAAQTDGFRVQGDVPGYSGKAYLRFINQRGVPVLVDSAQIRNGGFAFAGQVLEGGGFYHLNLPGTPPVTLLLESGDQLSVRAEPARAPGEAGRVSVSGSRNMTYYQQLKAMGDQFKAYGDGLNERYTAAEAKNDKATQKKLEAEFNQRQAGLATQVKAMLPDMGSSLAALYATNFLDPEKDFDTYAQMAGRFEKDRARGRQYEAFIATVRRMQSKKTGLKPGTIAPEITLQTPEGKVVPLSSLRGKTVLIDFWAAWCGPCRQENPNVVRLYKQYRDKGFEVYGVSLDSDRTAWTRAIAKDGLTWTQVSDLKYFDNAAAIDYGVEAIPFTVLVDPEGKIIATGLRGPSLEEKLAEIFKP